VVNHLQTFLVVIENIAPSPVIIKALHVELAHKTEEQKSVNGVEKSLPAQLLISEQRIIIFAPAFVLLSGGLNMDCMEKTTPIGKVAILLKHMLRDGLKLKKI